MSNAPRQSKNERRDAAREKARQERVRQQKREKRNRAVLQVSIGAVIIAIVAVVAVIIVNSVRPPGPGPANMANGGITLEGPQLTAVRTPAAAASATPSPEATSSDGKVRIQIFEDFACPYCKQFEDSNGPQVEELVKSGAAIVQYYPVAILDRLYPDKYSTRAANAAAAVANWSPNEWEAFHTRLYAIQPEEGVATSGPSDDQIIAVARQVGVKNLDQVSQAVKDSRFDAWVTARTAEFTEKRGALQGAALPPSWGGSTPTVLVNGQYYTGAPSDTAAFGAFVTSVGGTTGATPTPTPTPSASK
ncbi:DsbA family protein [Amnibacterium endophyticum]|uniref:DsbA family protein n=1 Tax=Amnibacterium endophyticum TaxID=2109337 RepID=A0ABW4LDQ5_9MICO